MSRNPYIYGPSVSGTQFLGREAELQQMTARILESAYPQPCSIVGETRIGKSSLLNVFRKIVEDERREDLLYLHYDMSSDFRNFLPESDEKGPAGTADFYRNFITRISSDLSDHPELNHRAAQQIGDTSLNPILMTSNIQDFFRSIRRAGYWLLLILDEFDSTTEYFRFDPTGWKLLRSLGNRPYDYGLGYLFASRRSIISLEEDAGISSNLASIFETIRLELMPSVEARNLVEMPIKQSGMQWSQKESDLIQQAGGNHPYCLQMICSHLFRQKEQNTISPNLEETTLIQQLQTQYIAFFEMQRRRLERSHLFEVLLRIAHGVPVQAEDSQIDELVRLGHLRFVPGMRNRFRPFSLALDYYLQARGIQEKLWPVVEETESALHRLIERQYQAYFGENWLEEIRKRNPSGQLGADTTTRDDIITRWEIEREKENHNPFVTIHKQASLIQYANPIDLQYLIFQQPELFQNVFPWQTRDVLENALRWLQKMRDLDKARYRRIGDEDVSQTERACGKLLIIIKPFLEQNILLPLSMQGGNTPPQINAIVSGKYKIVTIIKKTKHSYVVKARDTILERDVAIKFLLNVDSSRESMAIRRANLEREGKVLANLDHKNIGKVYDTIPEPAGMVMAWIEQAPVSILEMVFDDSQEPPLFMIASIATQLCDALNYIHNEMIIHRDIKPNNILLNKHNIPILIDFDIARSYQHETITRDKDGIYRYVGNEIYSAPEQFTMPGSVTTATDIFSLGVVLYQMLTHHLPFRKHNNPYNYNDEQLPPLEQEDIPDPLFLILCEMLKQDPKKRSSAHDLREKFAAYTEKISNNSQK